jgi:Major Facilitator Superfamily
VVISQKPLDWLNFFLADVKDGLGPFLAIYLLSSRHWDPGEIGVVMMIAGVATVAARAPFGTLIDWTRWKRTLIVIAAVTVALGAVAMSLFPNFWAVAAAQAVIGSADAVFPAAVGAISLGIVGPELFTRRVGRNEAFNHAGNAFTAIAAGVAGWLLAPRAVLWLVAALAATSILAVLAIKSHWIDHDLARGSDKNRDGQPSGLRVIFECKPLLIFTASITLFHFANAAMLPLLGEKLAQSNNGVETLFMAACIITAQIVMVPMALLVGHKADSWGRKPDLSRRLCRIADTRGALYADREPIRSRLDPGFGRDRRRHFRRSVLYRRRRSDAGNRAIQPRTRRRIGILGTGRRAQQFDRRLYCRQSRVLGGNCVFGRLRVRRLPAAVDRDAGDQ